MAPKDLNFITGNKNKLAEVQAILSETPVKLQSQAVDLVEIQGTIEEISTDKARRAAEAVCSVDFYLFVARGWFPSMVATIFRILKC
jgi:inosine/xanthosine triphosphate pyrophosphatase family protein